MKKFKINATLSVGFKAIIESKDRDHAFEIARGGIGDMNIDCIKVDNGHDWTVERIDEVSESVIAHEPEPM